VLGDVDWRGIIRDVGPALGVVVGGIIGVSATFMTLRSQRSRDMREMRRHVYVDWLRTARNLAEWPDEEPPTTGEWTVPRPEWRRRLNDLTTEMQVVASPKTIGAADAYLARIRDPQFAEYMAAVRVTNWTQVVDRFDNAMKPQRDEVLLAMRRDLGADRLLRRMKIRPPDAE
jgi:hypothetical protein